MNEKLTPNTDLHYDFIKELAEQLAYNYFANSFGDNDREKIHTRDIFKNNDGNNLIADKFEKDRNCNRRRRNILVIGAGASYDGYAGIPMGGMMTEELTEEYLKPFEKIDFLKRRRDQEEHEIKKLTNRDDLDFENFLYLLSTFFVTQEDLRHSITDMTQFRHSPIQFYEIVAHLLKHSFIDVVINFNFEEILDQAIKEEIGEENYHFVLSDGHCVKIEDLSVDGRLKTPIYIKPHGTFSHKTSLRFTKRHYLDLPPDIRDMLISLISGQRGKDRDNVERVNLITVGFGMQSMEFNEILNNHLPPYSRIYQIGLSEPKPETIVNLMEKSLDKFRRKAIEVGNINYDIDHEEESTKENKDGKEKIIYKEKHGFLKRAEFYQARVLKSLWTETYNKSNKKNELTTPLAETISVVWRKIRDMFEDDYTPRSIARHEFTSYLFFDSDINKVKNNDGINKRKIIRKKMRERYEDSSDYFKDRVMVEIALSLNRNHGIVDIIELLEGRIGIYYNLYRQKLQKNEQLFSIYELMNEFTKYGEISHDDKVREEFLYARNIFRIIPILSGIENCESIADNRKLVLLNVLKKNWLNVKYNIEKNGKVRLEKNEIIEKFKDLSKKILSSGNNISKQNILPLTILYHLLASDKISKEFKQNLMKNASKTVYNGKTEEHTLLNEMLRLLSKSSDSHYYYINAHPSDNKHYLWESYSKNNVLHTNLSLNYEFRDVFLRQNWDVFLDVSEVGNPLKILKNEKYKNNHDLFEELELGKRKIILICSYEAVRQLHGEEIDDEELVNEHKKWLIGDVESVKLLDILLIPFWQHNQHVNIFLKSTIIKNTTDIKNVWQPRNGKNAIGFNLVGSFYIYRKGFSNSIDPLFIGSNEHLSNFKYIYHLRDQGKLLALFFTYVCRTLVANKFNAKPKKYSIEAINLIEESENYDKWETNKFYDKMDDFLINLYALQKNV